MKIKTIAVSIMLFLVLFMPALVQADWVPGEILIKFKPAATGGILAAASAEKAMEKAVSNVGGLSRRRGVPVPQVKKWEPRIGMIHLKFDPQADIIAIIEKYRSDPEVEYAEPNYIRRALTTPNDTKYSQQWGLTKIMANLAWDIERGDTSVIIAVLDTGVDTDHEDLMDKLMAGKDCVNGDTDPDDDHGHGTHVAGIIGAITDNAKGVSGVSWYCKIMPVKVLNAAGSGNDAQLIVGILYAADNGAKVINMSLGGTEPSVSLENAVDTAYNESGCVLIAAAGNDGTIEGNYPAAYSNCIAVGATTESDGKASFSNYGSWIDVCAPGAGIWSTMPNHAVTMNGQGYSQNYDELSGTSMATPFVSGVAALIIARHGPIDNADVVLRIRTGVDDLGTAGKDTSFGYGRINVPKAIGDFLSAVDPIKIYTYPNPLRFPDVTKITIKDIPLTSELSVRIYNVAGELVRDFGQDEIKLHTNPDYVYIDWDGNNDSAQRVSAGVYLALVSDGTRSAVEKIMVIK